MDCLRQLHLYSKKISYSYSRFFSQFRSLSENSTHFVLLESGRGGRYSIAAFQPETIIKGKNNQLEINTLNKTEQLIGNPLHLLTDWLSQYHVDKIEGLPSFLGGGIGYISYDYARYVEELPEIAKDDLGMPEIYFFIVKEWFIYDHDQEQLWIMILAENEHDIDQRLSYWEQCWLKEPVEYKQPKTTEITSDHLEVSLTEAEFKQAVIKIQQ